VKTELELLLEAREQDYKTHLTNVGSPQICGEDIAASVRLHFVIPDANGEPRFRELARMLVNYITMYCFDALKRKELDEVQHNALFVEARELFRKSERSGQAGEMLVYFLMEAVLKAPQALRKMSITTNPELERNGSDGVHLTWNSAEEILEIYFAESKIWEDFGAALKAAFASVEKFHEDDLKQHELNLFATNFRVLDSELQEKIRSYIDGENSPKKRINHVCLIGFDWDEYKCLDDSRRQQFLREFEQRYAEWGKTAIQKVESELSVFTRKYLRFEFFFVPFKSVKDFRRWFEAALRGE
jgi:hypothetical protein